MPQPFPHATPRRYPDQPRYIELRFKVIGNNLPDAAELARQIADNLGDDWWENNDPDGWSLHSIGTVHQYSQEITR